MGKPFWDTLYNIYYTGYNKTLYIIFLHLCLYLYAYKREFFLNKSCFIFIFSCKKITIMVRFNLHSWLNRILYKKNWISEIKYLLVSKHLVWRKFSRLSRLQNDIHSKCILQLTAISWFSFTIFKFLRPRLLIGCQAFSEIII